MCVIYVCTYKYVTCMVTSFDVTSDNIRLLGLSRPRKMEQVGERWELYLQQCQTIFLTFGRLSKATRAHLHLTSNKNPLTIRDTLSKEKTNDRNWKTMNIVVYHIWNTYWDVQKICNNQEAFEKSNRKYVLI